MPRLRASRWRLQAHDASGKIAPGYSGARRCSPLPQSDPNVILVTAQRPTHQRYIQLTTSSYAHIFTQHAWFPFPNTSRLLEKYRNVTSVYSLVGRTITGATGIVQPNGNVRYTANLGFDVGTDQLDFLTQYFTVIVRPTGPETGDVVTGYPGR